MLRDLSTLRLKISYDTDIDDIVDDFYVPVLSLANEYDRIAGFFSSSSLALAARGMEQFLTNNGRMKLVTCPKLGSKDLAMIEQSVKDVQSIIADSFIADYSEIEDEFQKDHVKAMGWMLANGLLEMKIAIVEKDGHVLSAEEVEKTGIMHQKVGVFYDQVGNILSFSGSNNESASGWGENVEEFKVFSSWEAGMMPFVESDIARFNSFWNGTRTDVKVIDLPEAIEKHLIEESKDFNPSRLRRKPKPSVSPVKPIIPPKRQLELFGYQMDAVKKWNECERSLLLEMATGTGKTRTAIGCIKSALQDTEKMIVVIATPQPTLSSQWKTDISKLDVGIDNEIEVNGNIRDWTLKLDGAIQKIKIGRKKHLVVYTTHDLCHSEKFINIIKNTDDSITKFLVGDEVHGMGAKEMRSGLLDDYKYRLGLSATPQRWFDEPGSDLIVDYFGNNSFVFTIHQALVERNPLTGLPFLVKYAYYPHFISLTDDELEEYDKLTKKIARMSGSTKDEVDDIIQMMRFKRADIEKNAEEKYNVLESILDEIGSSIEDTIIFVSPEQKDRVLQMLGRRNIAASLFTQEQSTASSATYGGISEREYIIKMFKEKEYQVLVAIKCLDEGIDIPSAQRAILMASSTNPREYVQRIGRIIRQDSKPPGDRSKKREAFIHDIIIRPTVNGYLNEAQMKLEKHIFEKELIRVEDISREAYNNTTVLSTVINIGKEVRDL